MERAHLSIGQRLEQERHHRGWTQEYVAELIGVEPATVGRWERGLHKPQAFLHQKLCTLFGKTKQDLGLCEEDETVSERTTGGQTCEVVSATTEVPDAYSTFRAQDLTLRLQALVWSWLIQKHTHARYHELQTAIILALEQEDNSKMNDEVLSRRDALRRLASLPIDFCGLSLLGPVIARPVEEILAHCSAGIVACWQLRQGKDLAFAFDTASWYLPTLREIAASGSTIQRKEAADLLAQCYLLQSTLAKHLHDSNEAIGYAEQAEKYGKEAGNPTLQALSLRTQATAYFYGNQWKRALQTAEKAKFLLTTEHKTTSDTPIPLIVQSYVYAGLATYQSCNGQKQDAVDSLKKAHTTFFAHPVNEPVPIWNEHDRANLVINDGMTHYHLGLHKEAFDSFQQIQILGTKSESIRVGSLIKQVLAEASREDKEPDMDLCIELWTQGIEGAKVLGSQLRFNEAMITYATMCGTWRREKTIKNLRNLIVWPDKKSKNN